MNHYPSGLQVAYALLAAGLGFLTNLDSVAAFSMDDLDSQSGELHLVAPPDADPFNPNQSSALTAADAAYAQAMHEHISHLD